MTNHRMPYTLSDGIGMSQYQLDLPVRLCLNGHCKIYVFVNTKKIYTGVVVDKMISPVSILTNIEMQFLSTKVDVNMLACLASEIWGIHHFLNAWNNLKRSQMGNRNLFFERCW